MKAKKRQKVKKAKALEKIKKEPIKNDNLRISKTNEGKPEIKKIKKQNPKMSHKAAFKKAASNWSK